MSKLINRTLLALLLLGFASSAFAEAPQGGDKKKKTGVAKTLLNDQYDFISINNCLMWISNNGCTSHNPTTDQSGFEWPKTSAKYAIFEDGIVWGGTVQGEVRVGGSTYRYGLQAGPIINKRAADPSDPRYRIFKVRKVDEAAFARMTSTEQARLRKDFLEWPVADGAPYKDNNSNGQYDPNFDDYLAGSRTTDTPWFIGDEVIWFVSNDLDAGRTSNLYGTSPVGLEVQTMVWGYEQTGPLGNMVFTKYTVINKGNNDYENVYMSKWADPDLGDANDDFVGIDTVLSLGFVYNGLANDGIYGVPPAAGFDFFQGPIVRSPGGQAHYNFGVREGYVNLPISTFAFYINGNSIYTDPDLGTTNGARMMYNYQTGKLWNGNPYIDPTSGLTAPICLAGDPVKKTGWVDGILHAPGDRRFLMSAGPFTLNVGDTQEVVVSTMVGRGADRISSLQVLKYYDRFAQLAFDNNFDLPKAPPTPDVKVSLQNGKLMMYWGSPTTVANTENFVDRGYRFEGYNIYQFERKSSTLSQGKRLATFDKVNDITTIFDEVIDEKSGVVVQLPVQFGTDAGLAHTLEVTKDAFLDRPLVNNQPYYFAVTTYSYNPDPEATPRQLESNPIIIEVRPQMTNPGYRYGIEYNKRIPVNHTSGYATGDVIVTAIDPSNLTGDSYEVTFDKVGTVDSPYDGDLDGTPDEVLSLDNFAAWNLRKTSANPVATLINRSDKVGNKPGNFYTIDGFSIGISGSGYFSQYKELGVSESGHNEILTRTWTGGTEVYCPVNGDAACQGGNWWEAGYTFFGSALKGYEVKKTVEIRFDSLKTSKGYCYVRGDVPNYKYNGYFDSPITIWDVSNPATPKQLSYAFVEQKNIKSNDFMWAPTPTASDREYLFILDEAYSETPNPAYTGAFVINSQADQMPILYAGWYVQRTGISGFGNRMPWKTGAIWKITPNVPFSSEDKFTFTTPKPVYSTTVAESDISAINVFPNPYVGANAQELNKYQRFVTFNHLPPRAKFRIYTLSGVLVKSFEKNDASQYASWDLNNASGLPIGSGMYIIHIELFEQGGASLGEKVLKLGVVMENQYLDRI